MAGRLEARAVLLAVEDDARVLAVHVAEARGVEGADLADQLRESDGQNGSSISATRSASTFSRPDEDTGQ